MPWSPRAPGPLRHSSALARQPRSALSQGRLISRQTCSGKTRRHLCTSQESLHSHGHEQIPCKQCGRLASPHHLAAAVFWTELLPPRGIAWFSKSVTVTTWLLPVTSLLTDQSVPQKMEEEVCSGARGSCSGQAGQHSLPLGAASA